MWNIVTDSSCDDINFEHSSPDIRYSSVPFFIHTDEKNFTDDGSIDIPEMISVMTRSRVAKTACPSPDAWKEEFQKPGNTIAFTISAELSGSYSSACAAKIMVDEETPGQKIAIVNTRSDGPAIMLLIRAATRMIEAGLDFDRIVSGIGRLLDQVHIVYALSSFDNLIKNGRMSRLTGFVANALGFWGVGTASPEGKIQIKEKIRGTKRVLNSIIRDMKEKGSAIQEVIIVHCLNLSMAQSLREMIIGSFGEIPVDIFPAGGLDSFYAEKNGLIVGYRCSES